MNWTRKSSKTLAENRAAIEKSRGIRSMVSVGKPPSTKPTRIGVFRELRAADLSVASAEWRSARRLRATAPGSAPSSPSAWRRAQRADQVGEDRDGVGVAERGEAVEAEGVEVVAGEQGEVGVVAGEQAGLAVVEEVALADRLDDEGVLAASRPARRALTARLGRRRGARSACPRLAAGRRGPGGGSSQAPRRRLRGCGRSSPRRGRGRRTRPRTAPAAGRRRGRAGRGRSGRGPRCRRRVAVGEVDAPGRG